jgi:hypothetical protein
VEKKEKGAKKAGRSRYWSVMLVGDHGRVIPFRHFKALTVGVSIVLTLSLVALVLLGVWVTHQRRQIGALQMNLEKLSEQSTKLRDEKDLYLTQLMALREKTGTLPKEKANATQSKEEDSLSAAESKESAEPEKAAPKAEPAKQEVVVRKTEPEVNWSADIRNFKVSYDNRLGVLNAQFKIYNTSRPHKRLEGRTVVVFKMDDDPPIHWAVVPAVPLHDSTPVGEKGRFFSIRNYQTERFKTARRTNSPHYDMAAVYIFTDKDGELIAHKGIPFNVDYSPPAPAKPVAAPPKPEPEKSTRPPQASPTIRPESGPGEPGAPAVPNPELNNGVSPKTVTSPDAAPGSPGPALPGDKQPESQLDTDAKQPPEPGKSESTPQTPAPESKPAQEGDKQ